MKYIILVLGIFFGDEKVKDYIEKNVKMGHKKDILGGKVTVVKHHNKGGILNFMENEPGVVTVSSFAALVAAGAGLVQMVSKNRNGWLKLGLSLILGGGISNLYDRIKRGYVVDYFTVNIGKLKHVVFNLSDIGIFLGGLIVMIASSLCSGVDS